MSVVPLLEKPKTGLGGMFTSAKSAPYQLNDEAVLICENFYLMPQHFVSKVVLEKGQLKWQPPEINCHLLADQMLPNTGRGGKVTSTSNPPYQAGDEAQLHCDPGYVESYPFYSKVVSENGHWVWNPSEMHCKPISPLHDFPKTKDGGHLQSQFKAPYHINDTVTLYCEVGYTVPPKVTATVIFKNGLLAWDETELNCNPVPCGKAPYIANAVSNDWEYVFPNRVFHECKKGYQLKGPKTRSMCHSFGTFVPPIPNVRCDPVQCPELKSSENVTITSADHRFDSVAYFQCDKNYVMTKGDAVRVCQADGTWSGKNVVCAQRSYWTVWIWLSVLLLLILWTLLKRQKTVDVVLKNDKKKKKKKKKSSQVMNPLVHLIQFRSQKSYSVFIDAQQLYVRDILLFCTSLCMVRQLFGEVIICQSTVNSITQTFLDTKCFINGTMTKDVTTHDYYQWVSIYLLLLAFGFYLPYLIWSQLVGNDLCHLETLADKPNEAIEMIWESKGNFLFYKTLALEVFYPFQALFLLWCTDIFFNHVWSRSHWSWEAIDKLFPDTGYCFFEYNHDSGSTEGRFLCLLPLNSVYRKIFSALYLLMMLLVVMYMFMIINRATLLAHKRKWGNVWWAFGIVKECTNSWNAKKKLNEGLNKGLYKLTIRESMV